MPALVIVNMNGLITATIIIDILYYKLMKGKDIFKIKVQNN